MKIATVLLVVCVLCCSADEPCSTPTDAETKCMEAAGRSNGTDVVAHCSGVDFDALKNGDLPGSKICQFPVCIATLGRDIYTPCNRSDLTMCVKKACTIPGTNCTVTTKDQLQCMLDAAGKSQDDLSKYCSGVDLDLLREGKWKESKVCDHPDCMKILEKDLFTPCKRSDMDGCIHQVCMKSSSLKTTTTCSNVTSEELQCMQQAGTKNVEDIVTHCKGVDLNALAKHQINESHVCSNMECIDELEKVVYTPCKRSDLGMCLKQYCNSSSCKVSEKELKCMTDAGAANHEKLTKPCAGVDFTQLENADVKGSHICEHPECLKALNMYVYTPCKRGDITLCIQSAC